MTGPIVELTMFDVHNTAHTSRRVSIDFRHVTAIAEMGKWCNIMIGIGNAGANVNQEYDDLLATWRRWGKV